jgi:tRNA-Thr(GGU) m(6)t(6)A37 methyltransferase TsaA
MNRIEYEPIGTIYSDFKHPDDAPIQPRVAAGAKGRIEILAQFQEALEDLERFSHIIIIYHLHLVKGHSLRVKPAHDDSLRGVFATRSANRPNPIGISVVSLNAVAGRTLYVSNIDVVDGTPLLDIKPFVPTVDEQHGANLGWLTDRFDDAE